MLLFKPKLDGPDNTGNELIAHWYLPPDATSPPTGLNPFGDPARTDTEVIFRYPNGEGEGVIFDIADEKIIIPVGYTGSFEIMVIWNGGPFGPAGPPFHDLLINCIPNLTYGDSTQYFRIAQDLTGTCIYTYMIQIGNETQDSTFALVPDALTILPANSAVDIFVTQLNGNYT